MAGGPRRRARISPAREGDDMGLSYERLFQVSSGLLATADARGYFHDLERCLGADPRLVPRRAEGQAATSSSSTPTTARPRSPRPPPSSRVARTAGSTTGMCARTARTAGSAGPPGWTWPKRPPNASCVATALDLTSDRERPSQLDAGAGADATVYEKLFRVSVGLLVTLDAERVLPPRQPGVGALLGWCPRR